LSPGDAGYVVAAEIGSSALAASALTARKEMSDLRLLAGAALALLIVCDLLSYFTGSPAVFIACRVLSSAGVGALFAIGNAAAAVSRDPQRVYSSMMFVTVLFASILYLLAPWSVEHLGPRGPFIVLICVSLLGLPAIVWMPDRINTQLKSGTRGFPVSPPALLLLFAVFILYAAQSGLWAYVERIGLETGLKLDVIVLILTANGFIALGAAVLANWLGLRIGYVIPIAGGMTIQAVSAYGLPLAYDAWGFGAAAIVFTFGLIFVMPFLKATAADLDTTGRLATAATVAITLGSAAGPAIIGFALNRGATYADAAMVAVAGILLSSVATLLSLTLRTRDFFVPTHAKNTVGSET
jgi:predicted MFS family arabinose efflux permease